MKKATFLILILSLLISGGIPDTTHAGELLTMPEPPAKEHFTGSGNYACEDEEFFYIAFYEDKGITITFWYIEEVEYPIVVIRDLDNEVFAIHVRPLIGEVLFFPTSEAAEETPYPGPCDVKQTYKLKAI